MGKVLPQEERGGRRGHLSRSWRGISSHVALEISGGWEGRDLGREMMAPQGEVVSNDFCGLPSWTPSIL